MKRRPLQRLLRLMFPALALACGAAAMLVFLQPAHADPVIAATPTGIQVSWQGWLVAVLAGIGGALKILDVVLAGLKRLAPMTETTLDDRARDKLQVVDDKAHAKLDQILKVVGGLVPATGAPTTESDKPALSIAPAPRDSQAGFIRNRVMGAIAGTGIMLIVVLACTATQARQTTATGAVAALDCEAQHFDAAVMTDLRTLAEAKVQGWISGKAPANIGALVDKVKADLGAIKSDAGRCAITGVLAAATTIASPTPGEAVQGLASAPTGPDPVAVRAAFAQAAREFGWMPVKVAGGTVL